MANCTSAVNKNYQATRAALIKKGFTIASWARRHGFKPSTVYDAVRGRRSGIVAVKIVNSLEAFTK